MDISSIYVKSGAPNEIAIVTKFTANTVKNLLEDVFGIVAEPHGKRFYKLMYLKSSLWYYKGIPLIVLDNITWCKKFCITVNLKTHRLKIEDDNRVIDDILADYIPLEREIANDCHRDIVVYKNNILKVDDYTSDAASTLSGVRSYLRFNGTLIPKMQHDDWMASKVGMGWTYGDIKDPEKKTHPCLVPYEELPIEEQVKDYIFILAIERKLHKYKRFIDALNK